MLSLPDGKIYNFFIDDNIFFFTDICRQKCRSVFDHFYLSNLKKIHETYGTVFTLNCFYHNHHEPGFDLSQFPECYRAEFESNSHWLKFAFHAYNESPPFPYSQAYPEKLEEHYTLWQTQMRRIAGETSLIPPVIVHCFDSTPEGRQFLRQNGMKVYAVRNGNAISFNPQTDQLEMPVDMFLNLFRSDLDRMQQVLSEKIASGQQKILIGSHEQYAYSHYPKFIPEYFEGVENVCRQLTENGYAPVFYSRIIR